MLSELICRMRIWLQGRQLCLVLLHKRLQSDKRQLQLLLVALPFANSRGVQLLPDLGRSIPMLVRLKL